MTWWTRRKRPAGGDGLTLEQWVARRDELRTAGTAEEQVAWMAVGMQRIREIEAENTARIEAMRADVATIRAGLALMRELRDEQTGAPPTG